MRDRAGIVDLTAFSIFDVVGPGLARRRAAHLRRVPGRRAGRAASSTRRCSTPGGGFRSDLTVMRLAHDHFRVVTGGAHGRRPQVVRRPRLPADGSAPVVDRHLGVHARSASGARSPRHPGHAHRADDVSHEGFPVRHLPRRSTSSRSGAGLAHLLRRRARLGALRAVGAGRPSCGTRCSDAGAGARHRAGRHRRLRRPPAGSRRAIAPTASSSTPSAPSSRPPCSAPR